MHFGGTGIAHHGDDLLGGGAAHDGIIHQHDPFALDGVAVGIVLQPHAQVANAVRRLDKGAADIMVADDAQLERNVRRIGKAQRGGHTRVRHRDHHVGVYRRFLGQHGADILARLIHVAAFQRGIRTREIDVFEHAKTVLLRLEGEMDMHPFLVHHDHLARLDVAHIGGADDVQGAGFRRKDIGAVQLAQHQRAHPIGITHADQLLGGQRHQRKGAFHLAQRVNQLVHDPVLGRARHQMNDGLGVGGALEDRALPHQLGAQGVGVGQVAIVRDRKPAARQVGEHGLDIGGAAAAGGGIAVVADGEAALQISGGGRIAAKHIAHQAHVTFSVEMAVLERDDAAGFLAAMLQGVQAQHRQRAGIGLVENAEHTAFLMQRVGVPGMVARTADVGIAHRWFPPVSMRVSSA